MWASGARTLLKQLIKMKARWKVSIRATGIPVAFQGRKRKNGELLQDWQGDLMLGEKLIIAERDHGSKLTSLLK